MKYFVNRHGVINPMYRLIMSDGVKSQMSKVFEPVEQEASCDIEVVNLRTLTKRSLKNGEGPDNQAALIVHRQGFNACYKPVGMTCSTNGGKVGYEFSRMLFVSYPIHLCCR